MQTWSLAPGMQEDGTIDVNKLLKWVKTARARLKELDRIGKGDEKIGEMLGRISLEDKDGIWPVEAIRQVLEVVQNDDIKRGILRGEFNKRGARFISTTSPGQEQLDSAEKYAAQALQLDDQWPETAKLLREMAERYRIDAQDEKTRAEMDSFLD